MSSMSGLTHGFDRHSERDPMAALSQTTEQLKNIKQGQQLGRIRSRSAMTDALRRLVRNRAAGIGAVIVALNLLIALFAPSIAPHSYDSASLPSSNATPLWVTRIFSGMKPREAGGYVKIND